MFIRYTWRPQNQQCHPSARSSRPRAQTAPLNYPSVPKRPVSPMCAGKPSPSAPWKSRTRLTFEEAIETTHIHSVAGLFPSKSGLLPVRLFRAPHHTVSDAGLIGGGSGTARPGEASLANHGILLLDELPEFPRNMLEMLRQPLEDGQVTIARSEMTLALSKTAQ